MSKRGEKRARRNVQVFARVRPLSDTDRSEGGKLAVSVNKASSKIEIAGGRVFGPFDNVYGPRAGQDEIYNDVVAPLMNEVMNGFNCTVFAYGQTGTGKTFTMEGRHDDSVSWEKDPSAGLVPRALAHIFATFEERENADVIVRVSYVELYNEVLTDLLADDDSKRELKIIDSKGHGVKVIGVKEVVVASRNDVYGLLQKGTERRRTASTMMNAASSRSHTIFTISLTISTRPTDLAAPTDGDVRCGKFNLVDLAGSESIGRSGATSDRAREAGSINQSLLTLGRVISAVATRASHVPYRESKLTRLLQDSLGGKTITAIITTLSPSSTSIEESVNTLEYGQRARQVKNEPEAFVRLGRTAYLIDYVNEIQRLQRELKQSRAGVQVSVDDFERLQAERERNALLEDSQTRLLEDLAMFDRAYAAAYRKYQRATEDCKAARAEARTNHNAAEHFHDIAVSLKQSGEGVITNFEKLRDHVSETGKDLHSVAEPLGRDATRAVEEIAAAGKEAKVAQSKLTGVVERVFDQNTVHIQKLVDESKPLVESASKKNVEAQEKLEKGVMDANASVIAAQRKTEAALKSVTTSSQSIVKDLETCKTTVDGIVNSVKAEIAQYCQENIDPHSQARASVNDATTYLEASIQAMDTAFAEMQTRYKTELKSLTVSENTLKTPLLAYVEESKRIIAGYRAIIFTVVKTAYDDCEMVRKEAIEHVDAVLADAKAGVVELINNLKAALIEVPSPPELLDIPEPPSRGVTNEEIAEIKKGPRRSKWSKY